MMNMKVQVLEALDNVRRKQKTEHDANVMPKKEVFIAGNTKNRIP